MNPQKFWEKLQMSDDIQRKPSLTHDQLDRKVTESLTNDVTNVRCGVMALAAGSHAATTEIGMKRFQASYHENNKSLWGFCLEQMGLKPDDQDMLYIEFDDNAGKPSKLALIFPDSDLVALLISLDEEEDEDDNLLEPMCVMTVTGFFRYLNTLPNPLAYARQDQFMLDGTPEGLHFLKALCQYR